MLGPAGPGQAPSPTLPGGLVVRIRRSHRRGPGSIPGQGSLSSSTPPANLPQSALPPQAPLLAHARPPRRAATRPRPPPAQAAPGTLHPPGQAFWPPDVRPLEAHSTPRASVLLRRWKLASAPNTSGPGSPSAHHRPPTGGQLPPCLDSLAALRGSRPPPPPRAPPRGPSSFPRELRVRVSLGALVLMGLGAGARSDACAERLLLLRWRLLPLPSLLPPPPPPLPRPPPPPRRQRLLAWKWCCRCCWLVELVLALLSLLEVVVLVLTGAGGGAGGWWRQRWLRWRKALVRRSRWQVSQGEGHTVSYLAPLASNLLQPV